MSRLPETIGFSLTGQNGMLPIPILLFRSFWFFIVWTRLIQQLPLLVTDPLLKHRNFRLLFSIVATFPWFGLSSWIGGPLPSIYVSASHQDLFLIILAQRVPLTWVVVAVFRVECDTLGTTGIVGACCHNTQWLPVVRAWLLQKVLVQRDSPVKILTQTFILHDVGLKRVKANSLNSLTDVPDLGSLVNVCVPMLLQDL